MTIPQDEFDIVAEILRGERAAGKVRVHREVEKTRRKRALRLLHEGYQCCAFYVLMVVQCRGILL